MGKWGGGLGEFGSTDLILSAVRFQFRGAKLARIIENGGLGEIGSTDFILSTVRFQFRGAKLARVVEIGGTRELGATDLICRQAASSFAERNWRDLSKTAG